MLCGISEDLEKGFRSFVQYLCITLDDSGHGFSAGQPNRHLSAIALGVRRPGSGRCSEFGVLEHGAGSDHGFPLAAGVGVYEERSMGTTSITINNIRQ